MLAPHVWVSLRSEHSLACPRPCRSEHRPSNGSRGPPQLERPLLRECLVKPVPVTYDVFPASPTEWDNQAHERWMVPSGNRGRFPSGFVGPEGLLGVVGVVRPVRRFGSRRARVRVRPVFCLCGRCRRRGVHRRGLPGGAQEMTERRLARNTPRCDNILLLPVSPSSCGFSRPPRVGAESRSLI